MDLSDRDKGYLFDMLTHAQEVGEILKDETHYTFSDNRVKYLAVERLIEIIGEAANHVSKEVQEQSQEIPWAKIIGMRNKIVHDYGEILSDRIWLIATKSIPELIRQLHLKNWV